MYGSEKKITPAILTCTISDPAYKGELKKYLPITSEQVTITIQNKTIPDKKEIERLTLRASRSNLSIV